MERKPRAALLDVLKGSSTRYKNSRTSLLDSKERGRPAFAASAKMSNSRRGSERIAVAEGKWISPWFERNGALRLSGWTRSLPFLREPGKWVNKKERCRDLIEAMDTWSWPRNCSTARRPSWSWKARDWAILSW